MSDKPVIDATNYPGILEEIARIPATRPEDRAFLEEAAILVRGLAEENASLRALLREVEWSAREGRDLDRACPICSEWECLGSHAPDCRLKAAIG